MKRIACIVGARPQFIKHFPLEIELIKAFDLITIHTGQHYDDNMSQVFFKELGIRSPDFRFELKEKSHGKQTGEMLSKIEEILIEQEVQGIIVYGDTNSTLAGALAAAKLNIPIVHIEAGLRSFNKSMPEEVNRVLTDHLSTLLFCSSNVGVKNLEKEGVGRGVYVTGDLMKDALFLLKDKLQSTRNTSYYLATLHRPYNTDNPTRLTDILNHLNHLDRQVIFPIHPRTLNILKECSFDLSRLQNIAFVNPVGYIEMLSLLKYASKIITDSGGVQKEAYWMQKQCITLRPETEWIETLTGNWNTLVFEDLESLRTILDPNVNEYISDLYGNGIAAANIVSTLKAHFG